MNARGSLIYNRLTGQWMDTEGNPVHVHFSHARVAARVEGREAPALLFASQADLELGVQRAEHRRRSFIAGARFERRRQT